MVTDRSPKWPRVPPRKGFFVLQEVEEISQLYRSRSPRFLSRGDSILGKFCLVSKYLTRLLDYCLSLALLD